MYSLAFSIRLSMSMKGASNKTRIETRPAGLDPDAIFFCKKAP